MNATPPFVIFGVSSGPSRIRYDIRLLRTSLEHPKTIREISSVGRNAELEPGLNEITRRLKAGLDRALPDIPGRFLVVWKNEGNAFEALHHNLASKLVDCAARATHVLNPPPLLERGADGTIYAEILAMQSRLLLAFEGERLTIFSIDTHGVQHSPERADTWRKAQGEVRFEWRGAVPAALDIVRVKDDEAALRRLTKAFWESFSPSLEVPFIRENIEENYFTVGQADTLANNRTDAFEIAGAGTRYRRERFIAIVSDLMRSHAEDPGDWKMHFAHFNTAWTMPNGERMPATFMRRTFEAPQGFDDLMYALIRWLDPEGQCYQNLDGVRAKEFALGPVRISFQMPGLGLTAHERLEAMARAHAALKDIGLDPARFGL